jgi:hypothetical protein
VKEILTAGGYVTVNTLGSGFFNPAGVAVDGSGNVYVADFGNHAVKEILAAGGYTTVTTLGGGFGGPEGVAVDGAGNVFVADTMDNAVKEMPPGCFSSSCVVTLGNGFLYPSGVAVEANGNVLVADPNNHAIYEMVAAGGYTTVNTLSGGFSKPFGIALDGSGNVFVGDYTNSSIAELDYADAPRLSFGSIDLGANSAEQTVTFQNIGNAPLTLPIPSSGSNPSIAQNFALDSSASTACPVLIASSAAGSLSPGSSCTLSIGFDPTISSTITGSLVLSDNALNNPSATQTIALQGTGLAETTTVVQVSEPVTAGASATFTALVSSAIPGTLTGTVTFSVGSTIIGTVPLLANGTAELSVTSAWAANGFSVGPNTITATYSGDTNFAPSSGSTTLIISPAVYTMSASATTATIAAGGNTTLTLNLSSMGYIGTVSFVTSISSADGTTSAVDASAPPVVFTGWGNGTSTLTISTSASAAKQSPLFPWKSGGAVLFCAVLLPFGPRRKRVVAVLLTAFAISLSGLMMSCGGSRAARVYTVTVTPTGTGIVTNPAPVSIMVTVR